MKISTLCLGILSMGNASGYEIKKLLEGTFSHIYQASYGSIYPALNKLQNEGLVTCESLTQAKRPDKKVYDLTPLGRQKLFLDFSDTPGPDKVRSDFLVMMLFAHMLPSEKITSAINKRLEIYDELIKQLKARDLKTNDKKDFARGYGLAVLEAGNDYLKKNKSIFEN